MQQLFFYLVLTMPLGSKPVPLTPEDIWTPSEEDAYVMSLPPLTVKKAMEALSDEANPFVLYQAARIVALSNRLEEMRRLLLMMEERRFAARLEAGHDFSHSRTARLLELMARSQHANELCKHVVTSKVLLIDREIAVDFLLACKHLKEPPKEVMNFISGELKEGGYAKHPSVAEGVLFAIGNADAVKLIEPELLAKKPSIQDIRWDVVKYRNNALLIPMYARLLASDLGKDADFRNGFLQCLFDYKPRKWFRPSPNIPIPPPRILASREALDELLAIAALGKKLGLDDETLKSVEKEESNIRALVEFHKAGGPARVARLVGQLDDAEFANREQAQTELAEYGSMIVPLLEQAREHSSAEVRSRVGRLLETLNPKKPPPEPAQDRGDSRGELLRALSLLTLMLALSWTAVVLLVKNVERAGNDAH